MQPAPCLAYRDLRGKCQIYTKLVSQRPQNPLGNNQLIGSIFHFRGQKFDLVLFDLPGTINNPGVAKTVSLMDYIFCPVAADKLILESSLAFALKVRDEIMTVSGCSVKEMYMLWNLVDAREKTDLYDRYEEVFEEQMLQTLKTRLPDAKKYRREGSKNASRAVFRSSICNKSHGQTV